MNFFEFLHSYKIRLEKFFIVKRPDLNLSGLKLEIVINYRVNNNSRYFGNGHSSSSTMSSSLST